MESQENEFPVPAPEAPLRKSFPERLDSLMVWLRRLATVLAILVALIYVFREWTNTAFLIREVSVPASFVDEGFTTSEMAYQISNQLRTMVQQVSAQDVAQSYHNQQNLEDLSVDLVGVGIPIRSFVRTVGKTLGIGTYNEIRVAVAKASDSVLIVTVRITGHTDEEYRLPVNSESRQHPAQQASAEAAKLILKRTDPAMLARYYANHDRDGARTIQIARLMLEQQPVDDETFARAYAFWSFGYILERKYDLAIAKAKEGLQHLPDNILLKNSYAYGIGASGQYEEALKLSRSLEHLSGLTQRQRCTLYLNMGNYAGDLYQSEDSSLHYYQKALAIDPHFISALYNVALSHLYKGDTTQFYEYFERALHDGVNARIVFSNPELDTFNSRPRFRSLKAQYLDEQ